MLVGHELPVEAAALTFQLPAIPPHWAFLLNVIPAQLAAERLARLSGVNCDVFRYRSFIVEDEYGLLQAESAV